MFQRTADSGAGKSNTSSLQQDQTDKQPQPYRAATHAGGEKKQGRLPDINNVLFIGKWTMTEPQH